MGNNSDYIKDVEKYFLSLAGEGIMLSSMDYSLIQEWKSKEIPKECIFKGINRAFVNWQSKRGPDSAPLRNLKQCVQFIENSIEEYKPIIQNNSRDTQSSGDEQVLILERLNEYISAEKPGITQNYYRSLKEKFAALDTHNDCDYLVLSDKVEQEGLEEFFSKLSDTERDEITLEASNKVGTRARHMTEAALEESLASFRNEILIERYQLKSLI